MTIEKSFRTLVEPILNRYPYTSLMARWEEATSSDPDPKPLAFWIRETADLVNIVWLMRHDVRDITWFPQQEMSTFNLLRLSSITGFEVRQTKEAVKAFGLPVAGDYLIHVTAVKGSLFWVASNEREVAELRKFLGRFLVALEG